MSTPPKGRQILIVEDNPEYAKTLKDIIETIMEHVVTVAPTGLEGLRLAQANKYDLFLLDVNLPDMLGWDIARTLRGMDQYKSAPIIVMTAEDNLETRKVSLRSGCNIYLPKPIDIDALQDLFNMYLSATAPPPKLPF